MSHADNPTTFAVVTFWMGASATVEAVRYWTNRLRPHWPDHTYWVEVSQEGDVTVAIAGVEHGEIVEKLGIFGHPKFSVQSYGTLPTDPNAEFDTE